jgi:hypothetical protein
MEGIIITGMYINTNHLIISETVKGKPVIGIAKEAFINNGNLEIVTLPSSLLYIGDYAFYNNFNLREITFSSGLKSVEIGAFYKCLRLTSLILLCSLLI